MSKEQEHSRLQGGLNPALDDPYLEVMDFLNEIGLRYPEAVSLAPGKPDAAFFHVEDSFEAIREYCAFRARQTGRPVAEIMDGLGHYNKTRGIINDLLAVWLEKDEGIRIHPDDIVVTVGSQEAMALVCATLFHRQGDVLLCSDPAYIGLPGYAKVHGLETVGIPVREDGLDLEALENTVKTLRAEGKTPKAVYDVPDFHNPTGSCMPLEKRHRFIKLACELDILIIEDNPYGVFAYDSEPLPSLRALGGDRVLYLGTFSKTLFPGLRLGFMTADQGVAGREGRLSGAFSKVKSLMTTNTSTLIQAAVGGLLIREDMSLQGLNDEKLPAYRAKRDAMLQTLEDTFPKGEAWTTGIEWNRPAGGFFLRMRFPFSVSKEMLMECVRDYGVIFIPMSYFSIEGRGSQEIRLSFSYPRPEVIRQAVEHMAAFFKDHIQRSSSTLENDKSNEPATR